MLFSAKCTNSSSRRRVGKLESAKPLLSTPKPQSPTPTETFSQSSEENIVHDRFSSTENLTISKITMANASLFNEREPITGNRSNDSNKIFVTDFNSTPALAYVDIKLSSTTNQTLENQYEVRALHDSGCAKSVMKTSVFEELQKRGEITIVKPPQRLILVSCTGENQEITGLADIMLHFTGDNGKKMSFELNVIIHPNLSQDFLLGRDFTGSDAKAFETNNHLVLTNTYEVYWEPVRQQLNSKSLCHVPIVRARISPMQVATNHMTVIPPFSQSLVTCTIQKSETKSYQLPLETAGLTTYEVLNCLVPRMKTLPIASQYDATNNIMIPISNPTCEDVVIEQGELVAEIDIWKDEYEVHHMMMYPEVGELMFSETNHARPAFIEDDLGLNEEEKENAFMDYMRNGYHHPSMTKIVEDRAALTELYLKSTKAVPDHLFETQFDVAHLAPRMQEMALGIFRANIAAFSKHAADLGCAKDIEMKIPLKSNEPHVQKYIPVPHSLRPQLRAVLDQYLEYDIIRECDEPSSFCSNLLVVKKKDGKNIRVILDGRLINHYTIRQAAQFVSNPEVVHHLVGATKITTIDLSDAFFQMMLHADSHSFLF